MSCSLRFEVLNFDNGMKAKWYNLSWSLTRRMFEKFKSIYQENPLTQIERVSSDGHTNVISCSKYKLYVTKFLKSFQCDSYTPPLLNINNVQN